MFSVGNSATFFPPIMNTNLTNFVPQLHNELNNARHWGAQIKKGEMSGHVERI
jgi:hypothetical protein